jgi:hypothetical protein
LKKRKIVSCTPPESPPNSLKVKSGASRTDNSGLDVCASEESVRVWHAGQGTRLSCVRAVTEVVIVGNGVSVVGAVKSLAGTDEHIGLDKELSTITGVDTIGDSVVVAVVDVTSSEAEGWATRVEVVKVVVGEGNDQVTGIFISVIVRVSDQ